MLAHSNGDVNVTFHANGIYSRNSTYQYNLHFSKEDLETVLRVSGESGENGDR